MSTCRFAGFLKLKQTPSPVQDFRCRGPAHTGEFTCGFLHRFPTGTFCIPEPMPPPTTRPWEQIGIDFIGPLPLATHRLGTFDMLCIIIDLTSMVHLIPSRQDYKAKNIADIIFVEVYRHYSTPDRIISDRDSLFTSNFWKHLHSMIGVNLHKSSTYHPQSNGATEHTNRTVIQMLQMSITPEQCDWVQKLPAIEFTFNSATLATTGYSPFFLNFGR